MKTLKHANASCTCLEWVGTCGEKEGKRERKNMIYVYFLSPYLPRASVGLFPPRILRSLYLWLLSWAEIMSCRFLSSVSCPFRRAFAYEDECARLPRSFMPTCACVWVPLCGRPAPWVLWNIQTSYTEIQTRWSPAYGCYWAIAVSYMSMNWRKLPVSKIFETFFPFKGQCTVRRNLQRFCQNGKSSSS